MLAYKYTARDPATGQTIKAEVQADNEQAAAKVIRKEGLVPLSIQSVTKNRVAYSASLLIGCTVRIRSYFLDNWQRF